MLKDFPDLTLYLENNFLAIYASDTLKDFHTIQYFLQAA